MRIVSLTRESRRSDSSSITATSSFCAGGASSRMDDAAALIEVNGVLNSCARASSSIDFIASFRRAGFINLVRFAVKNRDAVDCEDLRDALGDLPRCG